MDEDSEYRSKLIGIVDAIDYFLNEYSSDFNWGKQSKIIIKHLLLKIIFFLCMYKMYLI